MKRPWWFPPDDEPRITFPELFKTAMTAMYEAGENRRISSIRAAEKDAERAVAYVQGLEAAIAEWSNSEKALAADGNALIDEEKLVEMYARHDAAWKVLRAIADGLV